MGAEQQKSVGGEERREIKGKLLVSNRGKKRRIIREKAESPAAQAEVWVLFWSAEEELLNEARVICKA